MAGRTRPSPSDPAVASAPLDWTTDWARQQLAVATEGTSVLFRGLQALRGIQEQAAQEASQLQLGFAGKFRNAATPADFMEVQGELVRSSLESAARYWQQVAATVLETNTELAGCAAHLVDTEDVFAAASAPALHS